MTAETIPLDESVLQKLRELPDDRRREVADFVEFLYERSAPKRPRQSVNGLWAGLQEHPVTEEDIAEAQREMWGNFPRVCLLVAGRLPQLGHLVVADLAVALQVEDGGAQPALLVYREVYPQPRLAVVLTRRPTASEDEHDARLFRRLLCTILEPSDTLPARIGRLQVESDAAKGCPVLLSILHHQP